MQDKKKPKIIVLQASLLHSIVSDFFTFAFLLLCIWVSKESTAWTFLSVSIFLLFAYIKITMSTNERTYKFYSYNSLRKWIDKQERLEIEDKNERKVELKGINQSKEESLDYETKNKSTN